MFCKLDKQTFTSEFESHVCGLGATSKQKSFVNYI